MHLQAAVNKVLSFPGSHLVLASDPVAALLLALRQPGCARDDALSLWIPMLPLWLASLYCWLIGKESRFLLSFPPQMLAVSVEVGCWSPSFLLGAGILDPCTQAEPLWPWKEK